MQTHGDTHGDGRQKRSAPPVGLKPKQHRQAKGQDKRNRNGAGNGKKQKG